MFNLYNICLLRAFEHIHMEFARYKCLLLLLIIQGKYFSTVIFENKLIEEEMVYGCLHGQLQKYTSLKQSKGSVF